MPSPFGRAHAPPPEIGPAHPGTPGHIRDNDAAEVTALSRETVVRELQLMALAQVTHDLRHPDLPLVKEVVFELEGE